MARQTRLFPKGKFIIRTPRNGLYNVYLQYTWQRNIYIKSTGLQVQLCDWDSSAYNGRGQFRNSYIDAVKQNNIINTILESIDAALFQFLISHPTSQLTASAFKQILNGENPDKKPSLANVDFVEFVCKRLDIEYQKGKIGISRYKNGLSCMRQFSIFLQVNKLVTKKQSLYLKDINIGLIEKYITYRKEILQNTDDTINHALTPIIKACNFAASTGIIDSKQATLINECRIKTNHALCTDDMVKTLTEEDLKKLKAFYYKDTEKRRKDYIDMYMFAFYCCGLRLVDVISLRWAEVDMHNQSISKVQCKTKNRAHIPISKSAMAILNRWKNKTTDNSPWVFHLLPNNFDISNDTDFYKRRNSITKKVDQSLIIAGKLAGISTPLTFHTARHTFATIALNRGVELSVVSRLLGHSSTEVTEKVYAQYTKKTLKAELEKLNQLEEVI